MLTHGHLNREALKELEEQFDSEESVAPAYLKTIFDHSEVCEDNFGQLRPFYNTLHTAVSTLKSLNYEHDLAARDNLRQTVQKLPETLKSAKSLISDQMLNSYQSKEPKVTQQEWNRRRNN